MNPFLFCIHPAIEFLLQVAIAGFFCHCLKSFGSKNFPFILLKEIFQEFEEDLVSHFVAQVLDEKWRPAIDDGSIF